MGLEFYEDYIEESLDDYLATQYSLFLLEVCVDDDIVDDFLSEPND